jgi:hypothetical protein
VASERPQTSSCEYQRSTVGNGDEANLMAGFLSASSLVDLVGLVQKARALPPVIRPTDGSE